MIIGPTFFALGCGALLILPRANAGQALPVVGDSAGIRIVEHDAMAEIPKAFEIVAVPGIDLGGRRGDAPEALGAKHPHLQVARLSDGRRVVSDVYSLKVFDAQGTFLRAIGRRGRGPGEFAAPLRGVCVARGDTIIAIGESARRVSVFTAEGEHVRTVALPGEAAPASCFADGSMLVMGAAERSPGLNAADRARRPDLSAPVSRVRFDAAVIAELGILPAGTNASSNLRTVNLVVDDELVHAGDGREKAVHTYSSKGTLIRILRWNRDEPLTAGERRPFSVGRVGSRAQGSTLPPPSTPPAPIPSYARVRVDESGRLWVEDHQRGPEPRGWTVFDATGGLLGRAFLPKVGDDVELTGFDGDQAVLRWEDRAGAVHLSFHAIVPLVAR